MGKERQRERSAKLVMDNCDTLTVAENPNQTTGIQLATIKASLMVMASNAHSSKIQIFHHVNCLVHVLYHPQHLHPTTTTTPPPPSVPPPPAPLFWPDPTLCPSPPPPPPLPPPPPPQVFPPLPPFRPLPPFTPPPPPQPLSPPNTTPPPSKSSPALYVPLGILSLTIGLAAVFAIAHYTRPRSEEENPERTTEPQNTNGGVPEPHELGGVTVRNVPTRLTRLPDPIGSPLPLRVAA
ncbi:hypothetical protein CMV_015107 [Castanea mollissima]|uniref:Uncharacterized protein n=1 Tax=Castanea mollissima TaxID=60419 RepID=A0A8J4R2A4_9ROSI|nr:hypothetical protein CMV_015107 [Castanea mollissima]